MRVLQRIAVASLTLTWLSLAAAAGPAARDGIDDEQPLWRPSFRKELWAGGATAEFTLLDAKGNELEQIPGMARYAQLVRRVGPYGEAVECGFKGNKVIGRGPLGRGLDAGQYELTLKLGVYGEVRHSFEIARGQQLTGTLKAKVWRRVIALKFADANGNAISWIPEPPRYTFNDDKSTPTSPNEPAKILRDPPTSGGRGGAGGFAYRRARGGGGRAPIMRLLTDDGRWHMRVLAGVQGTISVNLGKGLFERDNLEFEDTFEGDEWDEHVVTLTPTIEYAAATEARKIANESDPGNKSILSAPIDPPPPAFDPRDESTVPADCWRILVPRDAVYEISPKLTLLQNGKGMSDSRYRGFALKGDVWWANVGNEYAAAIEWQSPLVVIGANSAQHVSRAEAIVEVKPPSQLVELAFDWPSETTKALGATVHVQVGADASTQVQQFEHPTDAPIRLFFERSFLELSDDNRRVVLHISRDQNYYTGSPPIVGYFALTAKARKQLLGGQSKIAPTWSGVVWRSVDTKGRPLPWVEASLMTAEEAALAIELRKTWREVRQARLRDNADYKPDFNSEWREVGDLTTDATAREFLASTGAWYNTRWKAQQSGLGYNVIHGSLQAGKKYVLFLWSNSRDELLPDKRIDFTATAGINDLGVIVLPGYGN